MKKTTTVVLLLFLFPLFLLASFRQETPEKAKPKVDEVARNELEKLQGVWFHVSRQVEGKEVAGEDKEDLFVVRGNLVVLKHGTEVGQVGRLKLVDPIGNPKKLDLLITDGPNEGLTVFALYKVDNDVFQYWGSISARPKDFKTKGREGVYRSTYKRTIKPTLDAIQKWGGRVKRNEKEPHKPVVQVDLANTKITDNDLGQLKNLKEIRRLHLDGTNTTDAGLGEIMGLKKLIWLSLRGTKITDAGLAYLKDLEELQMLSLDKTKITDAGLAHLQQLRELGTLGLSKTNITDAGLVYVKEMKKLWGGLHLQGTQITNAGLDNIKDLKELLTLDVSGTKITDEGLAIIKGLTKLKRLFLADTQITDVGLEHVKELNEVDPKIWTGE